MENMRVAEYPKDEGCPESSSKSRGGSSSSSNQPEVKKGIFFGPKVLTKSDTDSSSRLLLGRDVVYSGILPFLDPRHSRHCETVDVLTKSDIDSSSRLLLGRDVVSFGILPFLDPRYAQRCETVDGTRINVHDLDTNSDHLLVLKMWKSNSFVLIGSWKRGFVKRRNLHKTNEIGQYWDKENCRLNFTVQKKFHVSCSSNEPEVNNGIFLGQKVLTKSDTDTSSRLLLGRDMVYSSILPFFDPCHVRRCETVDDTRINIHDLDKNSDHEEVLKMWKSNSFVLTGSWNRDFVKRRNLQKSDEIGLYWDKENCRLNFTIKKSLMSNFVTISVMNDLYPFLVLRNI
ncbi:hypothetical protein M9H77_04633 [Catharanthus roseus]|uniref:Uncharacterized protein n=1 Tax=Catharanthus roseus TaxID=4058 RepID=A0ACC0CEQ4_CATRO|nr:hypothetical protein M9H77_04633 [Catharanthus roseus]